MMMKLLFVTLTLMCPTMSREIPEKDVLEGGDSLNDNEADYVSETLNREHRQADDSDIFTPFDIHSILYPLNQKPSPTSSTERAPLIVTSRSIVEVRPTVTGPVFVPSTAQGDAETTPKENTDLPSLSSKETFTSEMLVDHLASDKGQNQEERRPIDQLLSRSEPQQVDVHPNTLSDLVESFRGRSSHPGASEGRSSGENRGPRVFPDLLGAILPQQPDRHQPQYGSTEGRPFLDTVIEIGSALINFKLEFFTKVLPRVLEAMFRVVSAMLQKQLIFLRIVDRVSQQVSHALNDQSYKLQHSLVHTNHHLEKTGDIVAETVSKAANTGGDLIVDAIYNVNSIVGGFARGASHFIEGIIGPFADPNGFRKVSKDVSHSIGQTAEGLGETAAHVLNGISGRGTVGSLFKSGANVLGTVLRIVSGENPLNAVFNLIGGSNEDSYPRASKNPESHPTNHGLKPSDLYRLIRSQNERSKLPLEVQESLSQALSNPEFLVKLNQEINKSSR